MHLEKDNSSWSFDGIAENFEIHARRSIPGYDQGHELICSYSDFFCSSSSAIIDVGCSTGLLLRKIGERHKNKESLSLIGIEPVKDMFELAYSKVADDRINLINDSIQNIEI